MATTSVPPDFQEFLKLLTQARVRYLLIGGYAVNLHGHSRRTDDLDVWVTSDDETAARLVDVFGKYGFPDGSISADLFTRRGAIVRVGRPPLRLEVFNEIAGVEFDACFARRNVIDLDGVRVNVINLRDLIKNKRAAGRAKDLADVEAFETALGKRLCGPVKRQPPKPKIRKRRM